LNILLKRAILVLDNIIIAMICHVIIILMLIVIISILIIFVCLFVCISHGELQQSNDYCSIL
jgi:hypothetical protein